MKKKGQEPVQAQPFSNHPDKSGLGVTLPRPRSCSAPPLCSRQGGTHAPGVRRPLASGGFPSEQSRGLCSGGDAGLWGRGCVATRQRPPSPQAWFGCPVSLHWAIQAGGKGALGSVGSQRPAASRGSVRSLWGGATLSAKVMSIPGLAPCRAGTGLRASAPCLLQDSRGPLSLYDLKAPFPHASHLDLFKWTHEVRAPPPCNGRGTAQGHWDPNSPPRSGDEQPREAAHTS